MFICPHIGFLISDYTKYSGLCQSDLDLEYSDDYDYTEDLETDLACLEWCKTQKEAEPSNMHTGCQYSGDSHCHIFKNATIVGGDGSEEAVCGGDETSKIFPIF